MSDGADDGTYDLICIGWGAGGVAAAAHAADLGATVLVAEKAPAFGGTTAHSYGEMWAADNHVQRAAGQEYNVAAGLEIRRAQKDG